jgi:hypothetical protein
MNLADLATLHAFTGRRAGGDRTYLLWADGVGWLPTGSIPVAAWLR